MTYYYRIAVKFIKGKESIIKVYKRSFLEIGKLFVYLEDKHKDNYTILSIEDAQRKYGKNFRFWYRDSDNDV